MKFQIWLNEKEKGFVFSMEKELPKGAGQVTLADMDGDGTIDLVFPVCRDKNECAIHVVHNRQMPLCETGDIEKKGCRDPHELCVADEKFGFEIGSEADHLILPWHKITDTKSLIQTSHPHLTSTPIPLRIGDFNNDGYPDILVTTVDNGVRLLKSVPCSVDICGAKAVESGRRGVEDVVLGTEAVRGVSGKVVGGGFLDLDEDGTLDVLVFTIESGKFRTHAFYNNFYNDAFFLKALVSNGVCPAWCPEGEKFPDPKPYGVNYAGATYKYTVLDTSGKRRANTVAQLPQSSYFALQTPYALFGLGRTNNYVEDLFVGVSRYEPNHVAHYQGVIPNSQLIIIPYEKDTEAWSMEMYVEPGSATSGVLAVLGTSLVLLLGVVAGLHWIEKREDELEKKKALHLLNFDAL
ncbi:hypothetical protein HK097_010285 [Rhizophlyctis rosea]|uniref:T-cell immunomodulatory protein TIP C2 domain-containing protein n=1 Tax=Rhizophlyctis rosea TaxID=64517 RepID=A0AAD5SIZ2_9FUNG|nr:hypothetical protein HK097_010285 [Rhizophlyctis rosea]